MKKSQWHNFKTLFLREAALIAKDHSLLLTLLIAPVLYAFFYGSIYINKEEEEIPMAIVDMDHSGLSKQLAEQINNLQAIELISAPGLDEAQKMMYKGQTQGYLFIENGLEKKVLSLQSANIVLAANAARFLPSSDLLSGVTQVSLTVGAGVRLKFYEMQGLNEATAMHEVMPLNLDNRPLFNERVSYGAFLLPGILALILQQTLLIGLTGSMASEREKNTINQLSDTAGNYSVALWGKGSFYFLLFMCYAFFFLTVNFTVLKLPVRGSAFDITVIMALFLLTIIPMGIWIGSLFKSQLLCVQIMAFSTYPVFLVTGYSWPFESLPLPLQWFSSLLPTTPFLKVYTSLVQQGGGLMNNVEAILHLLLLWLFYSALSLLSLKWINKRLSATTT
ncbi:ABC transporter permease [Solitalea canadensis]|uniref:ABC-type multidrug transport system, permease component n=1 Tax=Solitalea canadensis (strain ATCC 29591 / DSM 3403 / JCM 21819 / LMG 8368 / NBRC 15130 / NCIMB 12057 / USAM 9D) TaxID=929556 RepID=H8KND9_SOLCM|nr:ABC transporter permease [Solitalea canadensis]AFD09472.1 ABC-type multidrug transport system, permease component [Solitalea canadensis DSM 3403]